MIALEDYFAGPPAVLASAPGRINLLGEHTDYNDGFMLPTATPQRTEVALSIASDDHHQFYSATLDQTVRFVRHAAAPPGFGRYVEGCIRVLELRAFSVPPLRVYIRSDVPAGVGLSSSAALEIATLRALRTLLSLPLDDVALALIGQQAEIRYAQVNCGVMDQMASSLADSGHMLLLDARSLQHELLPLPAGSALVVIDSGVVRHLAGSDYNLRRRECEEAARRLGVPALRDINDMALVENLPLPLRKRARHVVSENLRVLRAFTQAGAESFGRLMSLSHASLRDDFEVSIPELDELTTLLRGHADVYGARLTGAGFGGACVALCRSGSEQAIGSEVVRRFNTIGARRARLLIPLQPVH
ncbi:galactokinase [Janthinobacterium agaricidamnosum]|uniref:Galactokinase n=1 Tax=Janthinobacterium agaricidamnosum NBRC 102515 = DSM 9628 TaxID=1349767 RepID=W0VC10_9BURK|nr:galactokinase [Janthinobacterium agaricidamnosum]CDG84842.1 galactokinase [Janthinobacterium agaricidamnosum NBRC 102515 = DSM 9628]